jgi:hypothetical protein
MSYPAGCVVIGALERVVVIHWIETLYVATETECQGARWQVSEQHDSNSYFHVELFLLSVLILYSRSGLVLGLPKGFLSSSINFWYEYLFFMFIILCIQTVLSGHHKHLSTFDKGLCPHFKGRAV